MKSIWKEIIKPFKLINAIYNYQWVQTYPGFQNVGTNSPTFQPPTHLTGEYHYHCVISIDPTTSDCEYITNTHIIFVEPAPFVDIVPQDVTIC